MKIQIDRNRFHIDNQYFTDPIKLENIEFFQLGERFCSMNVGYPEHKQLCDEITYVYDGEGINSINGETHTMARNTFNYTYPPHRHRLIASPKSNLRFFYLGFNLLPEHPLYETFQALKSENKGVYAVNPFRTYELFFNALNYTNKTDKESVFFLTTYINQILADFLQALKGIQKMSDTHFSPSDIILFNMLSYMDENFLTFTNLAPLSDRLGYSISYLSHLFSSAMQCSPTSYVLNKKMHYAKQLISEKEKNATEIAAILGYEDIHSFSKAFKNFFGVSPINFIENSETNK